MPASGHCGTVHRTISEQEALLPRLLLDTNVWSMLGRINGGPAFYATMAEVGVEVVLAPSVLLELGRSGTSLRPVGTSPPCWPALAGRCRPKRS